MKAPYRLTAVFLTLWPALVSAQVRTDLGAVTLDDLMNLTITTASRNAEGVRDAAAKVEVVSAHQIVARGYRCLADLLADVPGFKLDFAGDSDYPSEFTVQGTRGLSRVVLLLDGIRVSSPTGEPLPIVANYPVNQARQVEIVFGPSSALYGADAFSAVVNIISKDIHETTGFSFTTSAGMFGLYNQTASYGTRIGHASLIVNAQRLVDGQPEMNRYYPSDFGGMQAQRSGVFNTIYGPMTLDAPVSAAYHAPIAAHAVYALLRSGGWQVSLFQNRSRLSTTAAYTPDNAVYNDEAFNDNRLLVGAASYAGRIGNVTTTTTVTGSRHDLSPQSGYQNVYSNMKRSYKYAYGSMLKAEQQLSWKPAARATMTAGATFERFHAIPQGADLNEPIRSQSSPGTILGTTIVDTFYDLRYSNAGGFAQLQVEARPGVTLTLGGRADYSTRYGATFNPRIGLVAQPAAGTTFKLLFGSAYLAPSPYQAYGHYGSFYSTDGGQTFASDYWHVPNPALKPQHLRTGQATLIQSLGSLFTLTASAFVSRTTNLIQESDADQSYAGLYRGWPVAYIDFPTNEGRNTMYGGTTGVDFLRSWSETTHVAARFGVSLVDGTSRDQDDSDEVLPVGAMSPLQINSGLELTSSRWTASLRSVMYGRQRLLATTIVDGETVRRTLDGYVKVDLNVRRKINAKFDCFAGIENLFDARYRNINARAYNNPEELIGAPQAPRRLIAGVDVRLGR